MCCYLSDTTTLAQNGKDVLELKVVVHAVKI